MTAALNNNTTTTYKITILIIISVLVIAIPTLFYCLLVYVDNIDISPQRNPEVVAVLLCKLLGQLL